MQLEVGKVYEGKVTGITKFGAFVEITPGVTGMVHISEIASEYVKEVSDHIQEKQVVKVKVLKMGDDGKISLSIKKAEEKPFHKKSNSKFDNKENNYYKSKKNDTLSFEDMLSKFKQSSDEKIGELKRFMDNKRGSYSKRSSFK